MERRRVQLCIGATDSMLQPALFLPSSFIFPAQRLQVPAECRRAYNVSVLHLSPLLSDDRRSYTYKQSDTRTRCVYHHQTTEFVCFGNKSLRISTSHPVIKMNMSSNAKLRSKTRLEKRGGLFYIYTSGYHQLQPVDST